MIKVLFTQINNKMSKPFIHLRCLSSYSLSESTLKIKKLVSLAKKNNLPCFLLQKEGILSMGPGRKRATTAIISSNLLGRASLSIFFMPTDSNWNTAVVFASANTA